MSIKILWVCGACCLAAQAADDLQPLSDEFRSPATRANWLRIFETEGWGNDALATFDLSGQYPGRLLLVPHSSTWYQEWRGELTYKVVTGDFVITTDVEVSGRAGSGAPQSAFSLAGIMVRSPRGMTTPAQWTAQGQNYVFLSLGTGDTPGTFQHEVKTTVNSVSTLELSPGTSRAQIQVARIGPHLILLRRPQGGDWVVHRRYARPDFPATLQAGLTVYTDWPSCERVGFAAQNVTTLTNGARLPNGAIFSGANPDLRAVFDYVRYARPQVPAELQGAALSDPSSVSDSQLLSFLGDAAQPPAEPLQLRAEAGGQAPRIYLSYPSGTRPEPHRWDRLQVRATAALGIPWLGWSVLPGPVQEQAEGVYLEDAATVMGSQFYQASEAP